MYREYFVDIAQGVIAYVYFTTDRGDVKEFVVKLLFELDGQYYEPVRYDSGHACPHKDILGVDGEVIRKVWYDFLENGQALTMAITDIRDNYEFYRERYLKWLNGS